MIKIAVDAMGSDHAPGVEVEGAVQAASQLGVPIVLVGQESAVRPLLDKHDVTRSADRNRPRQRSGHDGRLRIDGRAAKEGLLDPRVRER